MTSLNRPKQIRSAARGASRGESRRGMSLLEVMLATVMLLGCVMALSRISFLARRHAQAAEDRTLAQTHCENIMQELLAGVRGLSSVSPESFEGGEWVYMVEVESLEQSNLAQVVVTVDRLDDPEAALPTEDEMEGYRLVRWIRSDKPPESALPGGDAMGSPRSRGSGPRADASELPPSPD